MRSERAEKLISSFSRLPGQSEKSCPLLRSQPRVETPLRTSRRTKLVSSFCTEKMAWANMGYFRLCVAE